MDHRWQKIFQVCTRVVTVTTTPPLRYTRLDASAEKELDLLEASVRESTAGRFFEGTGNYIILLYALLLSYLVFTYFLCFIKTGNIMLHAMKGAVEAALRPPDNYDMSSAAHYNSLMGDVTLHNKCEAMLLLERGNEFFCLYYDDNYFINCHRRAAAVLTAYNEILRALTLGSTSWLNRVHEGLLLATRRCSTTTLLLHCCTTPHDCTTLPVYTPALHYYYYTA